MGRTKKCKFFENCILLLLISNEIVINFIIKESARGSPEVARGTAGLCGTQFVNTTG